MPDAQPLPVYTDAALGAYGFDEKPWFRPHERLEAVLAALDRTGIPLAHQHADPATDEQLARFHTPAHIAYVQRRSATNRGSIDQASPRVNARCRTLLSAIDDHTGSDGRAPIAALAPTLDALEATFDGFAGYLVSEGVVTVEHDTVALTEPGRAFLADPDASLGGPTFARSSVEQAARAVCGAAIDATERIARGELQRAFLPIAGFHHAFPDTARNYCFYNDAALAVATARHCVDGPIAYIDVDIHHGDGVYRGFASDPRVLLGDLHADPEHASPGQWALTDRTGEPPAAGTACTVVLGAGTDDATYLEAFEPVLSFIRDARPSFVVFEAGVDGLATDPMSDQALTPAVFVEVARRVRALADETAEGRLLVLGGGGYTPETSADAWAQVTRTLL